MLESGMDEATDLAPERAGSEAIDQLRAMVAARDQGQPCGPAPTELAGCRLIDEDLAGLDLSGCNLSNADLSRAKLRDTRFLGANLEGACLFGAELDGCEFMGTNLRGADLSEATGTRAGFGQSNLEDARLFGADFSQASFTGAKLSGADLRTTQLRGARFLNSDLSGAALDRACLNQAELSGSNVRGASFHGADLSSSLLRDLHNYSAANWVGVDIRDVNFCGAWLLRRHIMDENFLYEFRHQGPFYERLYRVWYLTSNCGRSLLRWCVFTAAIAATYALLYLLVEVDYGEHETVLSPLYFSIVTITTLGYGDALPASIPAQLLVISEVVLGYLSLGGAVSIIANKLARRAG